MKFTVAGVMIALALMVPGATLAQSTLEITQFVRDPLPAVDAQGNSVSLPSSSVAFPLVAVEENGSLWVTVNGRKLAVQRRHVAAKAAPCSRTYAGGGGGGAGVAGAGPGGCPVQMGTPK